MANIKSAIKAIKVNEKRNLRNKSVKSAVRTAIKNFETTLSEGEIEKANELFPELTSTIDKAVAKGVYHKNTANRKKSKLALKLKAEQN